MKRCRHNLRCFDLAVVFAPHESSQRSGAFGPGWGNVVGQCRCSACGEVLPLGHSDETDPRVAQEIRAAEIAASLADGGCEMSSLEIAGFNEEPMPLRGGGVVHLISESTNVGHLARVIATHKETP